MSFITKMISGKSDVSSKRVNGSIGFLAGVILVCIITLTSIELTEVKKDLLVSLLVVSAALLGVTVFEGLKRTVKKQENE